MPDQHKRKFDDGFPILFEGITLPKHTYFIDVLGLYGSIPEISKEATAWLWRFTICSGKERQDSSKTIIQIMDEFLGYISADRKQIARRIHEGYCGEVNAEALISEWVETLNTIKKIAMARETCAWMGLDS